MIGLMIVMMAVMVFMSRYLFLEPRLPFRRLEQIQGLLRYCGPAVLTAIIAPIIFIQDEGKLNIHMNNPYLIAAVAACVLAYFTRKTLLTVFVSVGLFLLLNL